MQIEHNSRARTLLVTHSNFFSSFFFPQKKSTLVDNCWKLLYSRMLTAVVETRFKTPLFSESQKTRLERSTRNALFSQPPITPQLLIILTSNNAKFECPMPGGRASKRLQGQLPSIENSIKRARRPNKNTLNA